MSALGNVEPKQQPPLKDPPPAELGLVLLDASLRVIGADRGAAAILSDPERRTFRPDPGLCLPLSLLEALRRCPPAELHTLKIRVRIGSGEYLCRTYILDPRPGALPRSYLALHMEKHRSGPDTLEQLSQEYRLTEREHETLRGVALGLTTKELADRMSISPNTVKAFMRLIMIKMGVSTRAGIVAKLLARNGSTRTAAAGQENPNGGKPGA